MVLMLVMHLVKPPPPKQGFFLRPDRAFRNWWNKSGREPIPEGTVIPVQRAMQGHPEAPRLWEKHINEILCELGLKPTVHEPCLYSGLINGERLLFKRQVDDFATAAKTGRTSEILLDRLDDLLSIPIKRQGVVRMYNRLDIYKPLISYVFLVKLTSTKFARNMRKRG